MVKEIQYTSIKRVLDNIMDHPLLRDLNLDQAIRYTIRFIEIHGYPKLFTDKAEEVVIEDFRGLLPCDLISIIQVKDAESKLCLRAMNDNFTPGLSPLTTPPPPVQEAMEDKTNLKKDMYIPPLKRYMEEPSFKTQGRVIFTSFPKGSIIVMYKAIPVDENNYPMLIDNENYLAALEAYIKKMVFTIKYDMGKISAGVLQNAQQDYAWLAGQLNTEFSLPSLSEMESLTRTINTLIPKMREFDNGFRNLSDREYLRKH